MNILEWLKGNGYEYTWGVKLGKREPDIIAFNDNEVISFEIKKYVTELSNAIGQCIFYLHESNRAYIALKSKEIKKVTRQQLDTLRKQGIGLIKINKNVRILLEAKFFAYDSKKLIEKLKKKSLIDVKLNPEDDIRKRIVDELKSHPEGLPILEVAKLLGTHRHTITKYVYELLGSGVIRIREIGTAKVCFLNETFVETVVEKKILEELKRRVK